MEMDMPSFDSLSSQPFHSLCDIENSRLFDEEAMQLEQEMDQQTADLNGIEEQQIENQKAFSAIKSLQESSTITPGTSSIVFPGPLISPHLRGESSFLQPQHIHDTLKAEVERLIIECERLKSQLQDNMPSNGRKLWEIRNIHRCIQEAIDGSKEPLYSEHLLSSPHGYRMCMCMYPNGFDSGKGTHISLYFVIMRSKYDFLQSWPFKQSVQFTLFNQINPANCIISTLIPQQCSQTPFKKPESDMNDISGFPEFAPQTILQDQEFTHGNTLFIECKVDCSDLDLH